MRNIIALVALAATTLATPALAHELAGTPQQISVHRGAHSHSRHATIMP